MSHPQCVPHQESFQERKDFCARCSDPCERYMEPTPQQRNMSERHPDDCGASECDLIKLKNPAPCKPLAERIGSGLVPKGSKTSDYYRTYNIPEKFEYPDCFKGYGGKSVHPLYRTTNADYGSRAPNVHTVPHIYAANQSAFTDRLGVCGMYRNRSLNSGTDKSRVPDH